MVRLISGRDVYSDLCNDKKLGGPYIMGASNMTSNGLKIERWIENPTVIGKMNDIMISVKGTVGKLFIIDVSKAHLSRQVMSLRCFNGIHNKYIFFFLNSYMEDLIKKSTGVIPGISREDILNVIVPLPPLEEQKCIVEKVNMLMEYLDELENFILR